MLNNIFGKNRKSQMEIMGIAFVVILIVIGITLLVKYSIEPPVKTQEEFGRRELPKTIITSLVEITSTCNDEKMSDLIQDCALGGGIICGTERIDERIDSCQYLSITLKQILDEMLVKDDEGKGFGYAYRIKIISNGAERPPVTGGPDGKPFTEQCTPGDKAVQPMLYQTSLELEICY